MIYIIVLNHNNHTDTVECLESLFKLVKCNYKIIVCDNSSTNTSIQTLQSWAEGNFILDEDCISTDGKIRNCILPYTLKPINYAFYTESELDSTEYNINRKLPVFTLIKNNNNRGFSAGNNVGIKLAANQSDCEFLWVLNNDTVVEKYALFELQNKIKKYNRSGICGSLLYYYGNTNLIQAFGGGYYNYMSGSVNESLNHQPWNSDHLENSNRFNFVSGASMLLTKSFIDRVGLLNEAYFLYMEEIDLALRGEKAGFTLCRTEKSIIYHKEGSTVKNSTIRKKSSSKAKYHFFKSRLIFTMQYFPEYLTYIRIRTLSAGLYYLLKLKFKVSLSAFFAVLETFLNRKIT